MKRFYKSVKGAYFSGVSSSIKLLYLERFISIIIVVCLIMVALYEYRIILNRVQCIAALADTMEVRNRIIYYQSTSGAWPESEEDFDPIQFKVKTTESFPVKLGEVVSNIIRRGRTTGYGTSLDQYRTDVSSPEEKAPRNLFARDRETTPQYIVADGTVTVKVPGIVLDDEPIALLSLRYTTSKTPGVATLGILCGNKKPDNRFEVFGTNHTNIGHVNLPLMCK